MSGPTGRLVVYGSSARVGPDGKQSWVRNLRARVETPWFNPLKLMGRNISVIGVHLGRLHSRGALLRSELDEIFHMYSAGTIKPVIGKKFPLAEGAAAHQYIHDRKNIGKVILSVK